MAEVTARDAKLIQYLNEAYGNERKLETALQAHIAMTSKASYKKRLQDHLKETKQHAKEVERRIKKLGGKAEVAPEGTPDAVAGVAGRAVSAAQKGVALVQGQAHMLRGTGEQEKMLKNAKTEYQSEAEEIATYSGIEALATAVGDKETAKLAKTIRRQEERMASFLEKEIPRLSKAVAVAEIPAGERSGSSRRRSTSRRTSTASRTGSTRTSSTRASTGRSTSRTTASSRSAAAKRGANTRKAASTAKRAASSTQKAASSARSTARKAAGTARRATSSSSSSSRGRKS